MLKFVKLAIIGISNAYFIFVERKDTMDLVKRSKYPLAFMLIFVSLFFMLEALSCLKYEPVVVEVVAQSGMSTEPEMKEEELNTIVNPDLIREKYVKLDDQEDVQLIKDIEANTPLDFETAYVVVSYARKFDIKPSLLLAMIEVESVFDQYCVGTHQDRGYLQIIPPTEEWLAETFSEELNIEYNPEKIFDPEYNIGLGAAYISLLKNAYGDDLNRILSEYNRGPYNLKKFYEKHNTYETAYSRSILSREKKYEQFNR